MKKIDISKNQLKSLKVLQNMTQLESLWVQKNQLCNLEGVDKLVNLHAINVANNKITTLKELQHLTKMEVVDVSGNNVSNLSAIKKMTNLIKLEVSNNKIKSLPDLRDFENLSVEFTHFFDNKITLKEMKNKLPEYLTDVDWWLKNQYIYQKLSWKLNVNKVKKITKKTKTIIGKSEKKARITLETTKAKKLATVKTNSKGAFKFKKLNMKNRGKQTLYVKCYMKYEDKINSESHWKLLKKIKIKVKKI